MNPIRRRIWWPPYQKAGGNEFEVAIDNSDDRSYYRVMARLRNEMKRRQLLEAGVALFMERGYHGTGIKEVLDRVRVPKGSFYNYFNSKEDFARTVIGHSAEQRVAELRRDLDYPNLPALKVLKEALLKQASKSAATEFREGCLFGNLAAEVAETSEVCREAMTEAFDQMSRCFDEILVRGQREGTVRADIPAEVLANILLHAWEGSILRMKVRQSVEPLRECLSLLLEDFFKPRREGHHQHSNSM